MRNPFSSRKRIAVAAAGVAVLLGGVTALAYWTTSGSGNGSATAASGNAAGNVTVTQVGTTTGLVPGGAPVGVNVQVNNNNPGSVSVGTVSAVITPGWTATFGSDPNCTALDFTIGGPSAAAGVIAHGASSGTLSGITIALNDGALNQDACKNAVPTLVFTAAAGS